MNWEVEEWGKGDWRVGYKQAVATLRLLCPTASQAPTSIPLAREDKELRRPRVVSINLSPIRQPVNPLQHSLGQLFASLHYYFFSLNLLSSLNHVSKFGISGFSLLFSAISALLPHIHEPLEHGAQLLHHVMDQMNFLYLLEYIRFVEN
jgi:hypothetical protein